MNDGDPQNRIAFGFAASRNVGSDDYLKATHLARIHFIERIMQDCSQIVILGVMVGEKWLKIGERIDSLHNFVKSVLRKLY